MIKTLKRETYGLMSKGISKRTKSAIVSSLIVLALVFSAGISLIVASDDDASADPSYRFITQPYGGSELIGQTHAISWSVNFEVKSYEIIWTNNGEEMVADVTATIAAETTISSTIPKVDVKSNAIYRVDAYYGDEADDYISSELFTIYWEEPVPASAIKYKNDSTSPSDLSSLPTGITYNSGVLTIGSTAADYSFWTEEDQRGIIKIVIEKGTYGSTAINRASFSFPDCDLILTSSSAKTVNLKSLSCDGQEVVVSGGVTLNIIGPENEAGMAAFEDGFLLSAGLMTVKGDAAVSVVDPDLFGYGDTLAALADIANLILDTGGFFDIGLDTTDSNNDIVNANILNEESLTFIKCTGGVNMYTNRANVIPTDGLLPPNVTLVTGGENDGLLSWDDFGVINAGLGGYVCIFEGIHYLDDPTDRTISLNEEARLLHLDSGYYEYSVYAATFIDDEGCIEEDARLSAVYTGVYSYTSTQTPVPAPTNLRWEGGVAKWDPVPNYHKYIISLYNDSDERIGGKNVDTSKSTNNVCEFAYSYLETGEDYYFKVRTLLEDTDNLAYRNSDFAESPVKTFPSTATIAPVISDKDILTFDTVAGNDVNYVVSIYSGTSHKGTTTLSSPTFNLRQMAVDSVIGNTYGDYELRIRVLNGSNEPLVPMVTQNWTYSNKALTGTVSIAGDEKFGETLTANLSDSGFTGLSYQWKRGTNPIAGATDKTYTLIQNDIGNVISVVVTSSLFSGSVEQSTSAIAKADTAAPTGITATDCTTEANNNGTISGITAEMEYKLSTETVWTPGTGETLSNLGPGTYNVRVKETTTHSASASTDVSIGRFFSQTVAPNTPTDLTSMFAEAKATNSTVIIISGEMTVTFNKAAVTAIGGNTANLTVNLKTTDMGIDGAELVIELSLGSTTFTGGSVHVEFPFTKAVPEGKVAKVYYINGDAKTDMNATFADGKGSFDTDHFSTFAVFFDDTSSPGGGGFPIGAVIAIVVIAVVAIGAGVFFFLKKKNA